MGLSSILSTPLVLEDTIESVKSVGSKESSPNSISRNHSIEPMVPLSPTKFRADHDGRRETFRNKNWSRYHRSPRWSRGDERRAVPLAGRPRVIFPAWATRREKNKTNFTSPTFPWTNFQNSSTILRAKLQRTDFSRITGSRHGRATRFCLLYFRPFRNFPNSVSRSWLRSIEIELVGK